MDNKPQQPQHELIESALNKLAGIAPDIVTQDKLKEVIVDRVPKALYYQMLMDLLSRTVDDRRPEIILTEARFLVTLLLYKVEDKKGITQPRTKI